MGTTLTGTTPQDTYDSLIKVTDNGPISGSLKTLTDGLGNDSALALSTGGASITGTLAVSGNAAFDTNVLFVDATNNRVGIGTTTPADGVLNLSSATQFGTTICHTYLTVGAAATKVTTNGAYAIGVDAADGSTERMRISSTGNVGIGTSSPSTKLTVDNSALGTTRAIDLVGNTSTAKGHLGYFADGVYLSSNYFFDGAQNNDVSGLGQSAIVLQASAGSASNIAFRTSAAGSTATTVRATIDADGLKFNGDTLQVNALDDYEEGTWTATLKGSTTDPTTAVTTMGRYTKIGNRVSYSLNFSNVNTTGAAGIISVVGFPYTSNANQVSQGGVAAHTLLNLNGAAFTTAFLGGGSTQVNLLGTQSNGAWIDTIHNATAAGWLFISGTYEV